MSSAAVKSSLSSASKEASSSLSAGSSSASSHFSSASAQASAAAADAASKASPSISSATAKASAAASDAAARAGETVKSHYSILTIAAIIVTALAVAVAGLYVSGQADDLFVYLAKKYYKAEAKAEANALEQVGEGKAEGFLKGNACPFLYLAASSGGTNRTLSHTDQLKKNPVMGESELNQVQQGLGGEAVREGLGGVSGKLGGLGKF